MRLTSETPGNASSQVIRSQVRTSHHAGNRFAGNRFAKNRFAIPPLDASPKRHSAQHADRMRAQRDYATNTIPETNTTLSIRDRHFVYDVSVNDYADKCYAFQDNRDTSCSATPLDILAISQKRFLDNLVSLWRLCLRRFLDNSGHNPRPGRLSFDDNIPTI